MAGPAEEGGGARVAAVVLAAGESSRFGGNKLLAPLDGVPVVRAAVANAAAGGVDEVVVVLGRNAAEVREAVDHPGARFVVNDRYSEGLSTSIRAGIGALTTGIDAALIVLGDQPRMPAAVIPALLARYRHDRPAAVVPIYRGTPANPVLFDRSLFAGLGSLRGDRGARALIEGLRSGVATVAFDHEVPADVDTPGDLEDLAT